MRVFGRSPMSACSLDYIDHAANPANWAEVLGVSERAVQLVIDAHFIDLHCDLEVPIRVFGYDPSKHHRISPKCRH